MGHKMYFPLLNIILLQHKARKIITLWMYSVFDYSLQMVFMNIDCVITFSIQPWT